MCCVSLSFVALVVSLNDNNCKLLTAPDLIGAEDLVRVREGVYVTGTDDRAKVWVSPEHGPANTPSGALFAVRTADGHVERVRISGMPEVDFHPHGLFYAAHLDLLYVVNHAYGRGGERIEARHTQRHTKHSTHTKHTQNPQSEIYTKSTRNPHSPSKREIHIYIYTTKTHIHSLIDSLTH